MKSNFPTSSLQINSYKKSDHPSEQLLDEILQMGNVINPNNSISSNNNLSEDEKISTIATHVKAIMETLGLDLNDESLSETPKRVAKMYVHETFRGLNPKNKPETTLFTNNYNYSQMLVEKDITFFSTCEHHLVPIYGKAHVAYYSTGKVIGLSKLNRLVDFYARRPQVQERLTIEIAEALKDALQTKHVAVLIDANHMCVASRGIKDVNSSTVTAEYTGKFLNMDVRKEFLNYIKL